MYKMLLSVDYLIICIVTPRPPRPPRPFLLHSVAGQVGNVFRLYINCRVVSFVKNSSFVCTFLVGTVISLSSSILLVLMFPPEAF